MQLTGLLFFPVTPFTEPGLDTVDTANSSLAEATTTVDAAALARHIEHGLAHRPGAVFVACGTGEFHALSADEHALALRTAIDTVSGRAPVIAGVGGSLPHALATAEAAAELGADGILVLPPYLVGGNQDGLLRYLTTVVEHGGLPAIAYQRGPVCYSPESARSVADHELIVGIKDGLGDLDLLQRQVLAVRADHPDFMFFNGLPTAELTMKAYRGVGVDLYSSAVFAFLPEVAVAFCHALGTGDDKLVDALLSQFYGPLVELRNRVPGYAVSLVKAGVAARGLPVGGVRLPLVAPSEQDRAELVRLIDIGLELVDG
jgi:5-dehydro-4-deoxyglucarate dehydratase